MYARPLLTTVAVTGALVLGGAATGTTLALWRDQAAMAATAVSSGSLTVSAAGLGSLTGLEPGVGQVVSGTITDTSPSAAKNLRTTFHLDGVSTSNNAVAGHLLVSATAVPSNGNCTATTAFKPVGPSYTSTALTTTGLPAGTTLKLCLTVRLDPAAPSSARGQSATLTLTLRSQQVRP